MAPPSSLTSASASYALPPPDLAGARGGRDPAVRALEPVRPLGDALQRPPRQAERHTPVTLPIEGERRPGAGRPGTRGFAVGAEPETSEGRRAGLRTAAYAGAAGAEAEAPAFYPTDSVPFLVQLLGQESERPQVLITEHRDAAELGSDAYRRVGAAPPIYTEQATLFSFAI